MQRDVFSAIADPIRREILGVLSEGQSNLSDLIVHFEISRPGVAKHVRILQECGLVEVEKKGRERICSARLENLEELALWVHQYRHFWKTRLDKLEKLLKKNKGNS